MVKTLFMQMYSTFKIRNMANEMFIDYTTYYEMSYIISYAHYTYFTEGGCRISRCLINMHIKELAIRRV